MGEPKWWQVRSPARREFDRPSLERALLSRLADAESFLEVSVSLFEPDILNEAAFPRHAGSRITPERRLLIAILADAVDCYQKNLGARSARGRRLCREAERWILSDDQAWVFSFRNICDALGVDAEAMRKRARVWKTLQLARTLPEQESSRLNVRSGCGV
jgi:hypothetical protein